MVLFYSSALLLIAIICALSYSWYRMHEKLHMRFGMHAKTPDDYNLHSQPIALKRLTDYPLFIGTSNMKSQNLS